VGGPVCFCVTLRDFHEWAVLLIKNIVDPTAPLHYYMSRVMYTYLCNNNQSDEEQPCEGGHSFNAVPPKNSISAPCRTWVLIPLKAVFRLVKARHDLRDFPLQNFKNSNKAT
jgi:hypothetical protein